MWQADAVFALPADGGFVTENLALISAALLLIGWQSRRPEHRATV